MAIREGEVLHPDCFASACGGWSRNDKTTKPNSPIRLELANEPEHSPVFIKQ
ncbi:MAG: hypothetical protein HW402_568 [Dehalococcoidales bacterium]|nr:hypothetical protein [Dehalococcoidales bacterium]